MREIKDLSRDELEGIVRCAQKFLYLDTNTGKLVCDLDVSGADFIDAMNGALGECELVPEASRFDEDPSAPEEGPAPLDEDDGNGGDDPSGSDNDPDEDRTP